MIRQRGKKVKHFPSLFLRKLGIRLSQMGPETTIGRFLSGIRNRRQAEEAAVLQHFRASREQAKHLEYLRDSVIIPLFDLVMGGKPIEALPLEDALKSQNGSSPQSVRSEPLILIRPVQECTAIRSVEINGRTSLLCVREIAPVSMIFVVAEKKLPGNRVLGGVVDVEIDPNHVSFSSALGTSRVGLPKEDMTVDATLELIHKLEKNIKMPKPKIRRLGSEFA